MNHLLNLFLLGYRLDGIENEASLRIRMRAPNGSLASFTPTPLHRTWGAV